MNYQWYFNKFPIPEGLAQSGNLHPETLPRWTGTERLTDTYRVTNQVPLRSSEDVHLVNGCEITTTNLLKLVSF